MKIDREMFGELDGRNVTLFKMVNDHGMEVDCIDYGCIVTGIYVPDRNGKSENVVLGFDTPEEYREHAPYFGAIVGRHAGRIKNAEFTLDGKTYKLAKNDQGNNLHGGVNGFHQAMWETNVIQEDSEVTLEFRYTSRDGEEGFPGNLTMKVSYTLTNENEFHISYEGLSDQKTVVNLTSHSYFNLSGNLKRTILDHKLTIKSDQFLELDKELIPTGKLLSVKETPFDFRKGRQIKAGVDSGHPQNELAGNGFDHPFLLNEHYNEEIVLFDEESGRELIVETDQPAVVLFTASQMEGGFSIRGTEPKPYLGLCLETQGLPDSLHNPHFPSTVLEKGQVYKSATKYRFITR